MKTTVLCISIFLAGCATQPKPETAEEVTRISKNNQTFRLSNSLWLDSPEPAESGPPQPTEAERVKEARRLLTRWDRVKLHVSENRPWYFAIGVLAYGLTQSQHLKEHPVEGSDPGLPRCGTSPCDAISFVFHMCPPQPQPPACIR